MAQWALDRAERCADVVVDAVDLRDHAIPADLRPSRAGERLAWPIGAADAVLVVSCEYNHGYPASLKLAIDAVREQWAAKAVGFVSYGGLAGGLRAVEQRRQVFSELHAVTVRDTESFHLPHGRIDPDGRISDPELAGLAEAAADVLLDRLVWWGRALRAARVARPYALAE